MTAAPALKLYEYADDLETVYAWILEHEDEIRAAEGAIPDALAQLLQEAEGGFAEKAERVALMVLEFQRNARAVKEEEERLCARRKHYERAAESLKQYLHVQMSRAEIPKVEGDRVTVRLQKSPPCVEGSIPEPELAAYFGSDHELLKSFVTRVPERYALNARAVIDCWKATPDKVPAPLSVVQHLHVRIV